MTCYVYAFDLAREKITVALSFQAEGTAMLACESARYEMEKKHVTEGFHFDYKLVSRIRDTCFPFSVNSSDENPRVRIELPPWNGYRNGKSIVLNIDVFEVAEQFTEKILAEGTSSNRQDIQFMRYVKLIADGIPVSDFEKYEPTATPSPVEMDIAAKPFMTQAATKKNKSTKQRKSNEATKRRTQSEREKDIDKGIVDFFYYRLIGEKKTQGQIEIDLKLGQGALSDDKYVTLWKK